MQKSSMYFLLLFFSASLFVGTGCGGGKQTTGNDNKKVQPTTSTDIDIDIDIEDEDEDEGNSLNKLGALSSNVVTEKAEEGESGMNEALPFDASIRTGTLDNGMQYYIRKNAKPAKRIELRLAVNAGSMQEDDDQLGLAHFVEHMAFNGTTNFEKNDLVDFLEATGVRFGADLNAYTSFDETVYMLQLPTDKAGLVDKGLTVMSDWATGIAFEGEEIDKERGVIESEWRTGLGADKRMRQVWWPKVFYKTRYADRLPIGDIEIINTAPHDRFRRFYKDWYRPNLQAIIVVGDLDVDEIEAKIKAKFSTLKNPENSRAKKEFEVPDHKETFVSIATDKEATSASIQIYTKLEAQKINTLEDYRTSIINNLYNTMLNGRFEEISNDKAAPFLYAGGGYFNFVRTKDAYSLSAGAKENGILESLEILLRENQRVLKFGFTGTELDRAKLQLEKAAERANKESDKRKSGNLAMECVYHFLQKQPVFGTQKEFDLIKEFLPSIEIEEVNKLATKWIIEQNRSVVITAPKNDRVVVPTEAQVRKVLDAANSMEVTAYKDKFLDLPLMPTQPKAGKVTNEKTITANDLNLTELTLSNGIKVVIKPTTFQNDQILIRAFSPGGHSIYNDADFLTASNTAGIVDESGLGKFDLIALEKKLTGKTVGLSPYIGEMFEGFYGSSSVEDFETALQLVYQYATNPRKDKEAFERYMGQIKEQYANLAANPMALFQAEISKIASSDHPRRKVFLDEKALNTINQERAYEIYADRFSDFSDFTFLLVGNIDIATARPMLERYIGSLPSKNRKENWKNVGVKRPAKGITKIIEAGIAAQANVYMGFITPTTWDDQKATDVSAMSKVLSIMVRENLREEKGGVYSPYVGGSMGMLPAPEANITVFFQCAPDDSEELIEAAKSEVNDLIKNGPSDANYKKVLETLRRERETNLQKNNYWASILSSYYQNNRNVETIAQYEARIEKITKASIQAAAKEFLQVDKAIIMTQKPKAKK